MAYQLEHLTLNQQIYYRVRALIETGVFQPGAHLDERSIAQDLNVSRTPLREAIATLVEEGLVERRPYHGNFVRVLTEQQINDLYEVRKVLEGLAMRLAVPRLTEEHLSSLRIILDEAQHAQEKLDLPAYNLADQRFHETIAQITGNETLMSELARLKRQAHLVRMRADSDPQLAEHTFPERPHILAALEARNAKTAEQLMEEHIEGIRHQVITQMEKKAAFSYE